MASTCQELTDILGLEQEEWTLAELEMERDRLVARLEEGERQIESARAHGRDVARWEDFWINLLHGYERICDRLQRLNQ